MNAEQTGTCRIDHTRTCTCKWCLANIMCKPNTDFFLPQFKESVKDVARPDFTDHYYLRWLRGDYIRKYIQSPQELPPFYPIMTHSTQL